ncbi:MAG: hypothetical protein JWN43_2625 [Gammaproteobacteria bacterium]|nr:hypothetical protein [Gammaproteobacteria bacterium]
MAGHALAWAGVGASKVRVNHAATAGWNDSKVLMGVRGGIPPYTLPP